MERTASKHAAPEARTLTRRRLLAAALPAFAVGRGPSTVIVTASLASLQPVVAVTV
jgi:hypothetical protein